MTYEEAERIALLGVEHLAKIYFVGVDRSKVSAIDMLYTCPEFIKDTWKLMIDKTLEIKNA